ncbi:type I-F CRISPR-associated protein Csy1 [Flagellatimonas centrodinii]|uniref:type I-F CRISPR-associated protein Csy1 n=1 Tax=Flagellatimonas centrodinii TaxID=2806210 RepID=UPI001FEFB966|nr:type I-F CRISPR-associated protein Csy1 [Flagellatimonas centrodinii]ULQ48001.1 type I-F CRISPR-associated protein Csy1 [Flagellatimonas centrodinii]
MQVRSERAQQFRQTIAAFIEERRAAKVKGGGDDPDSAKYDYATWLGDAARRVKQIQAVTHVLKATHPDARGSNLRAPPDSLPQHAEIGTHSLQDQFADDIVGNAAALDVYKLLKIEVEGRRLLDWMQDYDADLLSALSEDEDLAGEWVGSFNELVREGEAPASHVHAKQLYWCVSDEPADDAGYQLLQPLFSSSLAHAVHADISDARFSDASKVARQAKRDNKPYDGTLKDYRNLVIRKLGGTKPQNISQLNSERGGVNYLLSSLPPQWKLDRPKNFLNIESALERFQYFEGVRSQIKALTDLLASNPPPTVETRNARKRIEQALGESLAAFGLATRQRFAPGWTRDESCKLPPCEQLWLDPDRTSLLPRPDNLDDDTAFAVAYEWKDWPDEVVSRFGNWLNGLLLTHGLPVGDAEHAHWARQAIIDAEWPAPLQRRAAEASSGTEVAHG